MDYKEKYEQAFERARNIRFGNPQSATANTVCEEIFPELKESEDERIRKAILALVTQSTHILSPMNQKSMIGWVKKQGEQKSTDKVEPKFKVGDVMRTLQEVSDGFTDGMPVVVSIDDKYYHCTNELISIKNQDEYEYPPINRRQKPAWSEEDEKMLNSIIEDVMPIGECPDYPTDEEREYYYEGDRKVEWLKSIKDKMKGE